MTAPAFTFRPLTTADLPLLHAWIHRPHVAEWWGEPASAEDVAREVGAAIESSVLRPFLAYLDDVPIAFIQAYVVMTGDPEWWPDETDPGARGIDQFLANASDLGKGLGSELVAQFVARLFADPAVTKVQTDPSPENARAIRAYEKAGFRAVGQVDTPDGPALLMVIRRNEWAARAR
jgi:RimJ/RimL family protein N-acetyltransferase